MKKGLMVALAAIAVTVSVAGCGGDGKLSNDYVTVNQYKGLKIAKVEKKEVSDDDVEQTIQSRLLSSGKTDGLTKDGAAEDGDWVNIDYSGSVDGTAFDGGTSTGYDLQLGSGTFLAATDDYKGFEEQIVGHKAGEEFDIQVQFPDPYQNNTDLSGKPADFHIVLNKVYAPAELTDEWVASNDDSYTTVDELRKGLKETMQEYYDSQYDSQVKSEIEDKLLETSEVKKYPDGAVDDKVSQIKESYETTVKNYYGMELSDFITSYLKTTEDDFNTKIEEQAKKTVQLEQALRLIAKKEKLELSDKDYEKEMKTYAKNAGADDVDSYKEQVGEDNLKTMILCDKVLDFLVDNCKQTEDASTSTGTSSTGTPSTDDK